jgi:hypothetical protein
MLTSYTLTARDIYQIQTNEHDYVTDHKLREDNKITTSNRGRSVFSLCTFWKCISSVMCNSSRMNLRRTSSWFPQLVGQMFLLRCSRRSGETVLKAARTSLRDKPQKIYSQFPQEIGNRRRVDMIKLVRQRNVHYPSWPSWNGPASVRRCNFVVLSQFVVGDVVACRSVSARLGGIVNIPLTNKLYHIN